ncbi:NAD(P)H-binding protein [Pseudoclavibacter sp. VKM Ac-2867]|uniref:NAD(P)H-binding protein n=1 Tax=Pseudoclavibacter sp. VKM Ac-2867 TaxID=2783829 RepID=UPI00188AC55A|nr:NAD(P)H-binding protein [Pseudoclavibacter sp. VKM Ac-2867]MBF4457859.1 NAD(P)H-binding protein [Pseudoclavibacter sp. VKM Ac-2867]
MKGTIIISKPIHSAPTPADEQSSSAPKHAVHPRVFIFGISGRVGRLLATRLRGQGVPVSGLVRTPQQAVSLEGAEVSPLLGDLGAATTDDLRAMLRDCDVVVYAAGSNAGPQRVTDDIDLAALGRVAKAVERTPGARLILLSVLPEAWRERALSDDEEHYFAAKKRAEVSLTRQDIDWVILRPSLLTDDAGTGEVSLGPAEEHGEIPREDVAAVLEALVLEPSISRQILELNEGQTPVAEAVRGFAGDV